jgi:hypothetical protein
VLHLIKLAVGPRDLAALRDNQARRLAQAPPLRAWTRMFPRRLPELLDGGSIYWVVGGFVRARQRLLAIEEETGDDGRAIAALHLDPALVQVAARPQKAFQGWRYLAPEDAPADLAGGAEAAGIEALPPAMRRELELLCLL